MRTADGEGRGSIRWEGASGTVVGLSAADTEKLRMRHPTTGALAAAAVVAMAAAALALASAGPADAQTDGFDDVPDGTFFSDPVSELAADGVFEGTQCDDGFCPNEPIDRKTMAVWTVRVLDGRNPFVVAQTRFNDVDGSSFYAPFIERMAELGVTGGCGDGSGFCPDRSVTRAQMAAFLSRAYRLPDGPDPGFGDVASDAWYAADVARLVVSGITEGCGDGADFCPEQATTRGQMAAFLHRAENRGGWEQIEGESADGRYVEFRASEDQTEVPWRPKGLALAVRCTYRPDAEEFDLQILAYGYGARSWFFGEYGVIEYQLGDEAAWKQIYAEISEDNNVLIVLDDDEEDFLGAMARDTSNQLTLSLYDERHDTSFYLEIDGELSVVGYREHVQPLVEACD